MPRYVAFLRAVNVGGRIVKMAELCRVFETAGLQDADSFIASGNILFSTRSTATATIETTLEAALRAALGYEVPVFVRSTAEVAAAAAHRAYAEADVATAGAHVVAFLRGPLDAAGTRGLAALSSPADRFVARGREVYWLSTLRQGESKMTLVKFEKAIGQPATMRSMTSVGKLAAKHCAG